jgi:SAM-dependent methyltransferase
VHYQPVILGAVPPGCGPALDVGCGDGMLASRLAERCAEVTGIDRDRRMIALARSRVGEDARVRFIEADFLAHGFPEASFDFACANTSLHHMGVRFIEADFLAHGFPEASFDFACANTSLHHMDFTAALTAMARALRPGGRLAVIGLAAHGSFGDYLADAPGIPVNLAYRAVYGQGGPGAPVLDPEMTWAQVRAAARRLLPGVRYRRHLLWRYSLLWTKPRGGADYSPMSAGVPLVMRMSSAYEVGKTVCGWPPAAQITSYLSSQVSTRVRIELGWPTGATPPMT